MAFYPTWNSQWYLLGTYYALGICLGTLLVLIESAQSQDREEIMSPFYQWWPEAKSG